MFKLGRLVRTARVRGWVNTAVPEVWRSDTNQTRWRSNSNATNSVPSSADVVVIGGGVIGCSTLYNLAKAGVTNAVLLERDRLTSGTTWHTSGMVWSLRPGDVEVELLRRSRQLMLRLEEETGVSPGVVQRGGLFIANNQQRLQEYHRLHTMGKAMGVESHMLDPDESRKLYPHMDVTDVVGTLYSPEDVAVDPSGLCQALVRGATSAGARVFEQCSVTGIDTCVDDFGLTRVRSVKTEQGDIRTDCVISATGMYSSHMCKPLGIDLPLVIMNHQYVLTDHIDEIQNVPLMRDHDLGLAIKPQGDTLLVAGYEMNPTIVPGVGQDFSFQLFDLDWDSFTSVFEKAIKRIPVLETTGIKSTISGPEAFTPDKKPLLGEVPELRGLWLSCGYNSAGMMLCSSTEQVVSWILKGRPELDMSAYDVRRFAPKLMGDRKWATERCHEGYARIFDIVYPNDAPLGGRNRRTSPLHQELVARGCVYTESQGWEVPAWFSPDGPSPVEKYDYMGQYDHVPHNSYPYRDRLRQEYIFGFPAHHKHVGAEVAAVQEAVGVCDLSAAGKYYLTGPDSRAAAAWALTAPTDGPPGTSVYSLGLNARGGVELDLTVSLLDTQRGSDLAPDSTDGTYYMTCGAWAANHTYFYLRDVIRAGRWRCELHDFTDRLSTLSVQGPNSGLLLEKLAGVSLRDGSLTLGTNKVVQVSGVSCRVVYVQGVGRPGWELHVPAHSAHTVYTGLMEAGRPYDVTNIGARAMDALGMEEGFCSWHSDIRSDDTPLEGGLESLCKLHTDVDFLGRQALEEQQRQGVHKKLVSFITQENVPLHGLEAIRRNDAIVGFVRRSGYAHQSARSLARGYVTRNDDSPITMDYINSGDYALECMGTLIPVQIYKT